MARQKNKTNHLSLCLIPNLHDLAEVPLASGRIAPGELLRCAKFDDIDSQAWSAVQSEYNFGLIVDLRASNEISERSGLFSNKARSACAPCACVNLPINSLGLLMPQWQHSFGPAWVYMRKKLWAQPETMFKKMYAATVLDKGNMHNFNRFFNLALAPRDGAFVWHCAQGTDRTGILATLFLEILGASRDDIIEHYASAYAHSAPADPRPNLLAAYEAIEGAYGSVAAYLTDGIGLTPDTQQALRNRFVI